MKEMLLKRLAKNVSMPFEVDFLLGEFNEFKK